MVGEVIAICSTFFTGDEPAASAGAGFDALLASRRDSSGEDGVDATPGSADNDVPGVIAADTNDWLLSSCISQPPTYLLFIGHNF